MYGGQAFFLRFRACDHVHNMAQPGNAGSLLYYLVTKPGHQCKLVTISLDDNMISAMCQHGETKDLNALTEQYIV